MYIDITLPVSIKSIFKCTFYEPAYVINSKITQTIIIRITGLFCKSIIALRFYFYIAKVAVSRNILPFLSFQLQMKSKYSQRKSLSISRCPQSRLCIIQKMLVKYFPVTYVRIISTIINGRKSKANLTKQTHFYSLYNNL